MSTKFTFDKFIVDLDKRVNKDIDRKKEIQESAATPQREYNRLYRERWQNRIKFKQAKK
tara:strand:+ start:1081 stop:1257 length:177 start_codon:yes stop_codon:yes gene_type:complete